MNFLRIKQINRYKAEKPLCFDMFLRKENMLWIYLSISDLYGQDVICKSKPFYRKLRHTSSTVSTVPIDQLLLTKKCISQLPICIPKRRGITRKNF
jgi:hypothetical protein